jgi:hypothetical protein
VGDALFSHHFARHTAALDLSRQLAMVRRIEQQQQKAEGVPSEQVLKQHIQQVGKDYRSQTESAHPVGSAP